MKLKTAFALIVSLALAPALFAQADRESLPNRLKNAEASIVSIGGEVADLQALPLPLHSVKVSFTAAQVRTWGSVPVTFLSGTSGYLIYPRAAVMLKPAGVAFDLGVSSFAQIKYNNAAHTPVLSITSAGTLDQTAEKWSFNVAAPNLSPVATFENTGLEMGTNSNGDYTLGGVVTLLVYYNLVPVTTSTTAGIPFSPLP